MIVGQKTNFTMSITVLLIFTFLAVNKTVGATYKITAGRSVASFSEVPNGIKFMGLYDKISRKNILTTQTKPLFVAELNRAIENNKSQNIKINALEGWQNRTITKTSNGIRLMWWNNVNPDLRLVKVYVDITRKNRSNALKWDINIVTKETPWIVSGVMFPYISIQKFGSGCKAFIPLSSGQVVDLSGNNFIQQRNIYPGAMSMQYYAVYDNDKTGLYVGIEDPTGSLKTMSLDSGAGAKTINLSVSTTAPNFSTPGNSYNSRNLGACVWEIFTGDWYEAALIYKSWTETIPWGKTKKRRKAILDSINVWVRPFWSKEHSPAEDIKALAKYLDTPIGYHMYQWFNCPWDNDYPHYFPIRPGVRELVNDLRKNKIYTMPYINARLWDTRDKGYKDFEFTSKAKVNTCKYNQEGDYFEEMYGQLEKDKSKVVFAIMCPATNFWQNKLADISKRLVNEINIAGLYFDQVAAAPSAACTSRTHGHLPGGGRWWRDSYGQLMAKVRKNIPEDIFTVSEMNCDAYIDQFDGYLTWQWFENGLVPAYPVIYGNKVVLIGCSYDLQQNNEVTYNTKIGQQLVFGTQLGWFINVKALSACKLFLKRAVDARKAIAKYMQQGQMLRPPIVTGDIPNIKANWDYWNQKISVTMPAIRTAIWDYQGKKMMMLVNVSKKKLSCSFDSNQYKAYEKTVKVVKNDSKCIIDIGKNRKEWKFIMQPLSIIILEIDNHQ